MRRAASLLGVLFLALPLAAQDADYGAEPAPAAQEAPATKKAKFKAKKKGAVPAKAKKKKAEAYDYKKSKYKAVLNDPPSTYRFDSKRNPVTPAPAKKPSKPPRSEDESSMPNEEGLGEACSTGSCE